MPHTEQPVLDEFRLYRLLADFENMHRDATGTHLTSTEFYRRYRAAEFDDPFAMAWATYYEAWCTRRGEEDDPVVRAVTDALPPPVPA